MGNNQLRDLLLWLCTKACQTKVGDEAALFQVRTTSVRILVVVACRMTRISLARRET